MSVLFMKKPIHILRVYNGVTKWKNPHILETSSSSLTGAHVPFSHLINLVVTIVYVSHKQNALSNLTVPDSSTSSI